MHDAQNLECADDPVTGGCEIPENNVATLLAAEVELLFHHFFDDVAITHFGAHHSSGLRGKRFIKTKIAHHRGDDCVLLEATGAQKIH